MDTSSLIIAICVAIPALIAFSVCGIIYCTHQNKNRKYQQQRSSPDECHHSHEQRPQNNYITDFSTIYRYQQQRRLRESAPVYEQSPPSYDNYPTNQIRRQPFPLFSPIRTTPRTTPTHLHQDSFVTTPSIYSSMPPSYDEIFLTPHTLTNR